MCLTDVGQVVAVGADGASATLESSGRRRTVSTAVLALEGTPVVEGQWLVVHTGLAVEVIDAGTAAGLVALRASVDAATEP